MRNAGRDPSSVCDCFGSRSSHFAQDDMRFDRGEAGYVCADGNKTLLATSLRQVVCLLIQRE